MLPGGPKIGVAALCLEPLGSAFGVRRGGQKGLMGRIANLCRGEGLNVFGSGWWADPDWAL